MRDLLCKTLIYAILALGLPWQKAFGAETNGINPRDYSIIGPSPEVAPLMDFKEYPVDYFHGIPTISLPIYTLKTGSIEVPVTIVYHGGGIRATQKTGNAGLGWSVICNSTISHTIYGAPDDANKSIGVHGLYHLNEDEKQFREKLIEKKADYNPTDGSEYKLKRFWEATLGKRYYEGKTDLANDMFNINGIHLSGTFVMDKDGKIFLSSDNPVSIQKIPLNTNITKIKDGGCDSWGFLIKDKQGTEYEFHTQERTRYDYSHGSPLLDQTSDSIYYASAWHVDKISDACGNEVKFSYKSRPDRLVNDCGHSISKTFGNPTAKDLSARDVFSVSSVIYHPRIISAIEASGITIKFNYYHEGTSHADALIKSIELSTPSGDKRIFYFDYDGVLLKSIWDGNQKIYSFEYNLDYGRVRYRQSQDFGGYCNENESGTLIPSAVLGNEQVGMRANRDVSPRYSHTLVLNKITYPTGGCTEFEWENNTVGYFNSVEYVGKLNQEQQISKIQTDTLRFCLEEGYSKLTLSNWHISQGQKATIDLTQYFLMNPANLYQTSYENSHSSEYYSEVNPPYYPHVLIRNHSTKAIEKIYYLDKETIEEKGQGQPIKLSLPEGYYDIELKNPLAIQGEEDFLKNYFLYKESIAGYIYLNKLTVENLSGGNKEYWCGLRIKSIKSSTGNDSDEPLRKYYYYNTARDPKLTSGTIRMLPKYDYMYYMVYPNPEVPGYAVTDVYCMGESAFPNSPLTNFSNIEYPQVMVCMGREDRLEPDSYLNYMAETFTYSSARNTANGDFNHTEFLAYQPIGSQMYTSMSHRRGNLEKHNIIGVSLPVQSTEYRYNIYESSDYPRLTTDAFVVCDYTRAPGNNSYGCYDYSIGTYSLIPYNKTVNCIRTTEEDGISSYKTFEYFYNDYTDKPDYDLVKSTKETDSSGLELSTYFTYPRNNNISLPYPETEVTVSNNTVVSASRTEYDSKSLLPLKKYTIDETCSPEDLISANSQTTVSQRTKISSPTFSYRYNEKGNLIEISYKNEVLASYIWGYNGQYPVIEAIGLDYESLSNSAIQAGLSNGEISGRTICEDSRISEIAESLRNKFPRNTISSISYDWFYGILTFTDGRGIHTTNSYDGQGRLTSVRDHNNYLISKFEYHYATENH